MKKISRVTYTTLLVALAVFCFVFDLLTSGVPFLYVAITAAIASVTILAIRATMVIWITIMVLLTFAGNRRRVLVHKSRRITLDVVWHLVKVLFRSPKAEAN